MGQKRVNRSESPEEDWVSAQESRPVGAPRLGGPRAMPPVGDWEPCQKWEPHRPLGLAESQAGDTAQWSEATAFTKRTSRFTVRPEAAGRV